MSYKNYPEREKKSFFNEVVEFFEELWNWLIYPNEGYIKVFMVVISFLAVFAFLDIVTPMKVEECWVAVPVSTQFVEGKEGEPTRYGFDLNGNMIVISGTSGTADKTKLVVYVEKLDAYDEFEPDVNDLYHILEDKRGYVYYGESIFLHINEKKISTTPCSVGM